MFCTNGHLFHRWGPWSNPKNFQFVVYDDLYPGHERTGNYHVQERNCTVCNTLQRRKIKHPV